MNWQQWHFLHPNSNIPKAQTPWTRPPPLPSFLTQFINFETIPSLPNIMSQERLISPNLRLKIHIFYLVRFWSRVTSQHIRWISTANGANWVHWEGITPVKDKATSSPHTKVRTEHRWRVLAISCWWIWCCPFDAQDRQFVSINWLRE